ncbi:MAG: glycosyltransferase [Candidatus Nomurabacteria bacterium]|nr:glycosyltransferase [Candidatus Nomurabacteria bacterium]
MKILYFVTKSNWGGAQRYVFDLAVSMKKRGHYVMVASGGDGALFDNLEKEDIRTYKISSAQRDMSFVRDIQTFFQVWKLIRKIKPDVVHMNSSKLGGIGAVAGRFLGARVIFTAHGWPFQEPRFFLSRWMIWFASWITAILAHSVITPSQNDLLLGQAMPFCGKKTKLIYHGRDIKNPLPKEGARIELEKIISIPHDKLWIGINAELHKNKGYEYLFYAMKNIDACLVIMGGGELRSDLEFLASDLGIKEKVFFLGFVPEGARYMSAFDILTLPSVKEGLPYVLLEGAQLGLPVVASHVGGIPEIIGDAGILVQPANVELLAHALSKVVLDEKARKQMGDNLHKRFTEKFSFGKMIQETENIYSA